jgi:hypothetical protein
VLASFAAAGLCPIQQHVRFCHMTANPCSTVAPEVAVVAHKAPCAMAGHFTGPAINRMDLERLIAALPSTHRDNVAALCKSFAITTADDVVNHGETWQAMITESWDFYGRDVQMDNRAAAIAWQLLRGAASRATVGCASASKAQTLTAAGGGGGASASRLTGEDADGRTIARHADAAPVRSTSCTPRGMCVVCAAAAC